MSEAKELAAVLIRGTVGTRAEIRDTLRMLNLSRKNSCIVVKNDDVTRNMLLKCKDYLTYGEVSEETKKVLHEKRNKGKKFYALNPPRGGFGRKGIKQPFNKKGALGYRGAKINDLIMRMI